MFKRTDQYDLQLQIPGRKERQTFRLIQTTSGPITITIARATLRWCKRTLRTGRGKELEETKKQLEESRARVSGD
ncbi:hypothetical protein GUITHDRAFT_119174 [Guillardia theta CCMP2712]|uniref:Uncharacterized protein n=1 Tax=Guillardia theta (strain CCMP2712) TaxID=905079 RepID=L1IEG6_GUITC|nr:hypothetical protein GUITHDRAFT_119174 [Guillardia theta CCMP2712]EKX34628.1 hypothetical protein GUITHDRAFT_119174 [Guillardia theta CCMP2712]|eukprot:XP_005821608.1 hypothetical protein GUITHDRAFT_119174 [Guillardia theta CCMP2712]